MGSKVSELMTRNLITVKAGVTGEAKRLLHKHRIEAHYCSEWDYECVGTPNRDMEKAADHPFAAKDEQERLRVAAATGTGEKGFLRAEMLIDAGVDIIVVDTAHGHSIHVINQVARIKKLSNKVQIIAGNVATAEAVKALIGAGADSVKIGIGPARFARRGLWRAWACRSSRPSECAEEGQNPVCRSSPMAASNRRAIWRRHWRQGRRA
jgi:IMP dehydrogenase